MADRAIKLESGEIEETPPSPVPVKAEAEVNEVVAKYDSDDVPTPAQQIDRSRRGKNQLETILNVLRNAAATAPPPPPAPPGHDQVPSSGTIKFALPAPASVPVPRRRVELNDIPLEQSSAPGRRSIHDEWRPADFYPSADRYTPAEHYVPTDHYAPPNRHSDRHKPTDHYEPRRERSDSVPPPPPPDTDEPNSRSRPQVLISAHERGPLPSPPLPVASAPPQQRNHNRLAPPPIRGDEICSNCAQDILNGHKIRIEDCDFASRKSQGLDTCSRCLHKQRSVNPKLTCHRAGNGPAVQLDRLQKGLVGSYPRKVERGAIEALASYAQAPAQNAGWDRRPAARRLGRVSRRWRTAHRRHQPLCTSTVRAPQRWDLPTSVLTPRPAPLNPSSTKTSTRSLVSPRTKNFRLRTASSAAGSRRNRLGPSVRGMSWLRCWRRSRLLSLNS